MDNDKQALIHSDPARSLPRSACLPINRCNLPAVILGSLTFQQYPTGLCIDGVREIHQELIQRLDLIKDAGNRTQQFIDYLTVHFRLHAPEEVGLTTGSRLNRSRLDYLQLLRGWSFDAESRDAAVMKGWAESRFGLLPRFHRRAIRTADDEAYRQYQHEYAEGLYNTNSIESQLDLIYCYCQYELDRQYPDITHLTLFRGCNDIEQIILSGANSNGKILLLLNNLNAFSSSSERASEFGDYVFRIEVPISKIVFYSELIPKYLKAENEYIVLGGVYESTRVM